MSLKLYFSKIYSCFLQILVILIILFASLFGFFIWMGYDVYRNLFLGIRTYPFSYYNFIDLKYELKYLNTIIIDAIDKYNNSSNFTSTNDSFTVNVSLNESSTFLFFLINNIQNDIKKNTSKEKLLSLIKSNNLMLGIKDYKLIVIFPVLGCIIQDMNNPKYHKLKNIIENLNRGNFLKNRKDYLSHDINFYVKFIFSVNDLKFKLDKIDFNDSFVVKYLIENEINTILNKDNTEENFIYKNFFDFTDFTFDINYHTYEFTLKVIKISIEENDRFTLTLLVNRNQ